MSGVFPRALIAFCRAHAIRNVDQNRGMKHPATMAFPRFFAGAIRKARLFQELEIYRPTFSEKKQKYS
jgi:hypothetical protein